MNDVTTQRGKGLLGVCQRRPGSFSLWREEPFRDRSPFWDRLSEVRLPNEGQGPSEDVVQCPGLYVKVEAHLVFEDVQGGPH